MQFSLVLVPIFKSLVSLPSSKHARDTQRMSLSIFEIVSVFVPGVELMHSLRGA